MYLFRIIGKNYDSASLARFFISPLLLGCVRSSVRSDICEESHPHLILCPIFFRLRYNSPFCLWAYLCVSTYMSVAGGLLFYFLWSSYFLAAVWGRWGKLVTVNKYFCVINIPPNIFLCSSFFVYFFDFLLLKRNNFFHDKSFIFKFVRFHWIYCSLLLVCISFFLSFFFQNWDR